MIRVPVSGLMRDRARYLQQQVKRLHGANDVNYTGLYTDDRFYYGYLGEMILCEYFHTVGKRIDYSIQIKGGPDDGDFHLHPWSGPVLKADVKTATKPFHRRIMMPEAQTQRHKYDIYIGAQLFSKELGGIWGWCYLDDFQLETKGFNGAAVSTMYRPLNQLRPMSELFDQIQSGEFVATFQNGGAPRPISF